MASTKSESTVHQFDHLVAAAEAVIAETLHVGDFLRANGAQFVLTTVDGTHEICFAPILGGRCYPVAYCLGEGRVAIERTAALRTKAAR